LDGSEIFQPVYRADNTEYSFSVQASRTYLVDPLDFIGIDRFKLRSGLDGAPVQQAADRIIKLILIKTRQ
jgi:hypothetical protein